MCLNPINIINPTKRISHVGGQKLKLTVNCNYCAECLNKKRDEYAFRTYWHCKDTINKGGYVLFDTLTYSDKYLPHISDIIDIKKYGITDFSCFNLSHYKLFFKRLRKAIYSKYKLTGAISYLFCSEYGTDDRYTHRPHYHPLIFVNTKKIHPLWLSRTIARCWQYGRTDGISYKPLNYVAKHIYGYNLGFGDQSETWVLRAVTQYVSKYITKSSEFQSRLDMRINSINVFEFGEDELKLAIKSIKQFSRISSGYGIGFLDNLTDRDIESLKDNSCLLPDKEKVIKTLPLPMYYIRKLYYECVTSTTGNKVWQLTPLGLEHFNNLRINQIIKTVIDLTDLYDKSTFEQKSYIDSLLDGRSLHDYCIYTTFYKGRLRERRAYTYHFAQQYGLTEREELGNTEWNDIIDESSQSNTENEDFVYTVDDKGTVNLRCRYCRIISFHYDYNRGKSMDKRTFVNSLTFNESSAPCFRNFDLLGKFFDYLTKEDKYLRQKTYEYNKAYEERMSLIFK